MGTFQSQKLKKALPYLIFANKRSSFLKVAKRRKIIVNILKWKKSIRMRHHFLKIIKKVSFFFYLNMICAPFRLLVFPEKLHQKLTWLNKVIFVKPNATRIWLKNCHLNQYEINKCEYKTEMKKEKKKVKQLSKNHQQC